MNDNMIAVDDPAYDPLACVFADFAFAMLQVAVDAAKPINKIIMETVPIKPVEVASKGFFERCSNAWNCFFD